jgi:hypothetical protein
VYHENTLPSRKEVEAALKEAGFAFCPQRSVLVVLLPVRHGTLPRTTA